MRSLSSVVVTIAILFFVNLFCGVSQARSDRLSRIILDVPVKPTARLARAIDNVLMIFKDRRFSYLDLSIQFPIDQPPPFIVTRDEKVLELQHNGCHGRSFPLGGGRIYNLAPINNNLKLILSVVTGEASQFPYLDVSCEYKRKEVGALRVRGFFHIVCHRSEDRLNVQLRPFNPPLDQARRVLMVPVKPVAGQIAKLAAKRPAGKARHPASSAPQAGRHGSGVRTSPLKARASSNRVRDDNRKRLRCL